MAFNHSIRVVRECILYHTKTYCMLCPDVLVLNNNFCATYLGRATFSNNVCVPDRDQSNSILYFSTFLFNVGIVHHGQQLEYSGDRWYTDQAHVCIYHNLAKKRAHPQKRTHPLVLYCVHVYSNEHSPLSKLHIINGVYLWSLISTAPNTMHIYIWSKKFHQRLLQGCFA